MRKKIIDYTKVKELNEQGFSDTQIAKQMHCDRHLINKIRKELKLPVVSISKYNDVEESILEYLKENIAGA